MVTSVVNKYKWPPYVIGGLFFDEEDHFGLEFWYNQVKLEMEEIDKIKSKKK